MEYIAPPPLLDDCQDENAYPAFDVIYPRHGFKIYLPVDEQGYRNEIIMDATHRSANAKLYWYLNETYLGETNNYHQMAARPAIGKHQLTIIDQKGKSVKIGFEIVGKRR